MWQEFQVKLQLHIQENKLNPLTRKIRNKGYTLIEFCIKIGYSLRWYREYCKREETKQNEMIQDFINELESKQHE